MESEVIQQSPLLQDTVSLQPQTDVDLVAKKRDIKFEEKAMKKSLSISQVVDNLQNLALIKVIFGERTKFINEFPITLQELKFKTAVAFKIVDPAFYNQGIENPEEQ